MFSERTNWNLEPNWLARALVEHRARGRRVIDLTLSNPTEFGFEYRQSEILRAMADPATLRYEPHPKGLPVARQAVADYYRSWSVSVSPEDLILTASTSEAYSYVFRTLCNPGDEILIPAPSYPLFEFLADILDVNLARYALIYDHGWQVDFHGLKRAITSRTRAVIVVNPNNPTGHFSRPDTIARMYHLCSHHDLAIVADEVFLDYSLGAETPASFAGHTGALTFTLSGLSKICGLPQMKLAWLLAAGPVELKKEALDRMEVIADTFLSVSTPVQLAVPALLGGRRSIQEQISTRIRKNLAELDHQLAARPCCSRLQVEGGWNAVLRAPSTRPDEDLTVQLLQAKDVYVHPGEFYDFAGSGFLVASLITPEREFAEGIARLLSFF